MEEKITKKLIPKDLFEMLACPSCNAELSYSNGQKGLICSKCSKRYKIRNGTPFLL